MSFFSELKRRNVFKVAIAYFIVSWLILQLVDVVTNILVFPDWFAQAILLLLAIMFPIMIMFTWAFELTPTGIKKTDDIEAGQSTLKSTGQMINYTIITVLIMVIGLQFWINREEPTAEIELTNSIAVLPFVNMSEDENNVYFSDGLSEELLNVLVKMPDLKVAGRTSSFAYRGQNLDLPAIGETLGVNHLLEGSVRKQGNQVRITAQLIRADDGFQIWGETFNRELSDIFMVQEEIANAIVSNMALSMDISVTPTLIVSRTENMQAYEHYLEAKSLIIQRAMPNLKSAIMLLNEAIKLDPDYAVAWGSLAQAHALAPYYPGIEPTLMAMSLAENAARRALLLDENSSIANTALGDIEKDRFNWAEAEEYYLKALNTDSENAEANEQFGQFYMRLGHHSKALPYLEKAYQLEPSGLVYSLVIGSVKYSLYRKKEDLDLFMNNTDFDHFAAQSRFGYGLAVDSIEESKNFLAMAQVNNLVKPAQFFNNQLIQYMDDPKALSEYLRTIYTYLESHPQELNAELRFAGTIYAQLAAKIGDYELALDYLEMEQSLNIEYSNNDGTLNHWVAVFDPIQNHPRFKAIRRHYGMVDYWQKYGWPDFCQPVGDDDFECGWVQTEEGG